MKKIALLALTLTSLTTQAATSFGGFSMHSSVPQEQVNTLINDFKYIYQNPVVEVDDEFLKMAGISKGDGPSLHNWLLNRAKYIVGEKFEISEANIVMKPFKFPSTPLPELPPAPTSPTPGNEQGPSSAPTEAPTQKVIVMSNLGTSLYVVGKTEGVGFGIKFDGKDVVVTSPRIGVFQVGKGLFLERFLLNKTNPLAPANSIFRLGTLAHESRHSDGNGLTTGLMHIYCPVGHPFEGFPGCDSSSNGPYTVGGLAERHMLNNCSSCTLIERMGLMAGIADSFNRVINPAVSTRISELAKLMEQNQVLISTYETLTSINVSSKELLAKYNEELKKLKAANAALKLEIESLDLTSSPAPTVDANPEGTFTPVTLKESMRLMQNSL